jgi:hypothetical protein
MTRVWDSLREGRGWTRAGACKNEATKRARRCPLCGVGHQGARACAQLPPACNASRAVSRAALLKRGKPAQAVTHVRCAHALHNTPPRSASSWRNDVASSVRALWCDSCQDALGRATTGACQLPFATRMRAARACGCTLALPAALAAARAWRRELPRRRAMRACCAARRQRACCARASCVTLTLLRALASARAQRCRGAAPTAASRSWSAARRAP